METWAIAASPMPTFGGGQALEGWNALGFAVSAIGEPEFSSGVLTCVNHALPVDFWSVYRVGSEQPPQMYVSGSLSGRDVSIDCFKRYRQGLYKNDQTFAPARKLVEAGQPAMTRWNEAEIPEPHREQIYRRHDILERLSVVSSTGAGLLAVNLYRFRKTGAFRDREIDAASDMAEFLSTCVGKHLMVNAIVAGASAGKLKDVRPRLAELCSQLTRRELDVCERLLKGWTYDGIANDMALSVTSVKTYRARAFDRLGIHFRNQLFALVN